MLYNRSPKGSKRSSDKLLNRVVFNWVSKVIQSYFGFALLYSMAGPNNSCLLFNQSNAKSKPILTWSHAFTVIYLHLASITCIWINIITICFKFSLVLWFYDTQLKTTLVLLLRVIFQFLFFFTQSNLVWLLIPAICRTKWKGYIQLLSRVVLGVFDFSST